MNNNRIQKTNKKVYLVTFFASIFAFSAMLIMFLSSFYFREVVDSDNTSIFYVIISIIVLFFILNLHNFVYKLGKGRILIFLLLSQIFLLALLVYLSVSLITAIILVLYIIICNILMVVWDAILEEYSENDDTGRIRGLFLTFWNLGGMIAPAIGAIIVNKYGFSTIFIISLVLYIIIFILSLLTFRKVSTQKKENQPILKLFKRMRLNKDIWNIYWISLVLRIFYSVGTIFFPLYLISIGLSISQVGIIFTATFIPFVLIEYKLGVLADNKYGEKEMLIIGLAIMAIFMMVIYYTNSNSFIFWLFLLMSVHVGAAFVESMSDIYFYKKIDSDDIAIGNFFRSSRPLAYLAGAVIGGIMQMHFGFKVVFLSIVIIILIGLYPAIILKDTNIIEK